MLRVHYSLISLVEPIINLMKDCVIYNKNLLHIVALSSGIIAGVYMYRSKLTYHRSPPLVVTKVLLYVMKMCAYVT